MIQEYIDLIEKYESKTYVQHVNHTYVTLGSIAKTAEVLKSQGHTIESEEVTAIIKSTPLKDDLLHKKVKNQYLKKIRPSRKGY